MQILFSTGKLNLRNDLAHCNSTYKNYYHLNVTALLYGILGIINNEFYLA